MELLLHIGTEKTGSSYLQTLLALNREQLMSANIYYPDAGNREEDMISGKISPGNGKNLYVALQEENQDQIRSLLSRYKDKAQKLGCEVILISNENLIEPLSKKHNFDQIVNICLELDIQWSDLLLVLRDPVDQALSLYKHRAKNGNADPLSAWLKNGYNLNTFLNDFLSIKDHKEVSLTIRKYKKDAQVMQKIMFEDWLQVGKPKIPFEQTVNPSLTISELLILKNVAQKNEKWVKPLYEKLLGIPLVEKDNEYLLKGYYWKIISKELSIFNNVWQKCNHVLNVGEKLMLPEENIILPEEGEVLSFSPKQTEQIVEFLLGVRTKPIIIKSVIKKIIRKLKYFFKR